MEKWFDSTFLPSIFDRVGTKGTLWLSAKQTAVCARYMDRHECRRLLDGISYGTSLWYSYKWRGRDVHLTYSKLNGCGTIEFYMTEEESAAALAERDAIKAAEEPAKLARLFAKRPERFMKKLEATKELLEESIEALNDAINDGDEEAAKAEREWVTKFDREYKMMLAAMQA